MPYATLASLTARYGADMLVDLTDRAMPPAGEIDAGVVDEAIADADAIVDGYLAGRYALPLSGTPRLVQTLAEALAVYKLHAQVAPDKIEKDYRDALKLLQQIATGEVRLAGLDGAEPAASGGSGVRTTDRARPLSPESMKGFV
jgi:phage gp36-like protein